LLGYQFTEAIPQVALDFRALAAEVGAALEWAMQPR